MRTVIVYGPPASGKTRNAEALLKMYGCKGINDEGKIPLGKFHLKEGYLNLVTERPDLVPIGSEVYLIHHALKQLENP